MEKISEVLQIIENIVRKILLQDLYDHVGF